MIAASEASPRFLPLLLAVLPGVEIVAHRELLAPASRRVEERRETLVEAVQAPA